jgi:hypothetical protein
MGKNKHSHQITTKDLDRKLKDPKYELLRDMTAEEKQEALLDMFKMKKVLNLISIKIQERFPNILSAFRFFDNDH